MSSSVLHSWKEIARYLGCGVRTVQRWEHDLGLPVRRPRGEIRSAVIALTADLDAWLATTPIRRNSPALESLMQSTLPVVAIVDDDEVHRYSIAMTVARAGFSVVEASSGTAAIRLLRAVRPNVAVVDVHMPEMDGFEVCRRIKNDAVLSSCAVVIHTAIDDTPATRQRAHLAGASAFLGYPMETQDLISSIRKFAAMASSSGSD
jgi:CheY-like chemotaxis protein